jgi:hypothetical protein
VAVTLARRWAGRVDGLLTPDRLVVYPVVITVLFVVVWAISLRTNLPLPDFLARWTAGRLVADGQAAGLYDPAVQSAVQAAQGASALSWFVSPPTVALLFVPFGILPYSLGAVLWTAVSVALLVWSFRALSRLDPAFAALGRRGVLLVVASTQPVLEVVGAGQDSAVVLAALVGGAALLVRRRPVLAGLVLSATLIKPQLAILVPVALLLCGAWRALAGMTVGGLALVGVTTAVLGTQPWVEWTQVLRTPLYESEVVQGQAWKTSTIKGLLDAVGAGAPSAVLTTCWVLAALAVLALTARGLRRGPGVPLPIMLLTLTPVVTVLVTPHALVYDLVVLIPAAVWVVDRVRSPEPRALLAVGYVLLFVAPLLHLASDAAPWPLTMLGAPWVVVTTLGLWWLVLDRLTRSGHSVDDGARPQLGHSAS